MRITWREREREKTIFVVLINILFVETFIAPGSNIEVSWTWWKPGTGSWTGSEYYRYNYCKVIIVGKVRVTREGRKMFWLAHLLSWTLSSVMNMCQHFQGVIQIIVQVQLMEWLTVDQKRRWKMKNSFHFLCSLETWTWTSVTI